MRHKWCVGRLGLWQSGRQTAPNSFPVSPAESAKTCRCHCSPPTAWRARGSACNLARFRSADKERRSAPNHRPPQPVPTGRRSSGRPASARKIAAPPPKPGWPAHTTAPLVWRSAYKPSNENQGGGNKRALDLETLSRSHLPVNHTYALHLTDALTGG